jgi:hypothetical protein
MDSNKKENIRKLFGSYLKNRREKILKVESVRQLSFSSNLDPSKLTKIEKGLIDVNTGKTDPSPPRHTDPLVKTL